LGDFYPQPLTHCLVQLPKLNTLWSLVVVAQAVVEVEQAVF
jgi:hypothetical protein